MSSERSLGWGVAMILIVGTALGLTHNWAGLRGRPPHGIPWVSAEPAAVSLESLTAHDSSTAFSEEPSSTETGGAQAATPVEGSVSSPTPTGARESPAVTHPVREQRPGAATPPTATPAASSPAPSTPAPPAASLPVIPDSEQPIEIKLAVAKAFFDADAALFIDARDPEEYEAGHIARALRMTHNDALAEPEGLKSLPVRGRPIIAYCSGGECEASHDLARDLIGAGYRKVLVYTGGFPEWASSGHPIEKGGR